MYNVLHLQVENNDIVCSNLLLCYYVSCRPYTTYHIISYHSLMIFKYCANNWRTHMATPTPTVTSAAFLCRFFSLLWWTMWWMVWWTPLQRECFWVKHYAGKVKYTVGGWVERNMDSIPQSFNDTLKASTNQASRSAMLRGDSRIRYQGRALQHGGGVGVDGGGRCVYIGNTDMSYMYHVCRESINT